MSRPALPPCALPSVAPLGQRGREGVSIPPPYPLWTPYPPLNDQGMSPWTQMRKVAPGVWLKKLFTARQMYCASLFPGAIRPALRLCMRALRARLPNVPNGFNDFNGFTVPLRKARNQRFQRNHDSTVPPENHEINDFNGFTVPPEKHDFNEINEITISRPPNGITKATKPTKTTKCLFCGHFVFFVVYGEIVGFVENVEAPLSVSPPCGRLASSPEGGAKSTAVKPGERVVRRSCKPVCLTTAYSIPAGVLLAPPVGELSAKLTERALPRLTCFCTYLRNTSGSCRW